MAIQFVGGNKGALSGPISLTALTGGIDTEARAGDVVIAITFGTDGSFSTPAGSYSGGTTAIGSDSDDCKMAYWYKKMTATPDTTFSVASPINERAAIVQVWRGVDQTTQLDVAVVSTNGANSFNPDPAAITPITSGAIVIATGVAADRGSGAAVTSPPSGYTNSDSQLGTNGVAYWCIGVIASKFWSGAGPEDPGAWTMNGTDTGCSWGAITIALRPAIASGPANLKTWNTNPKANIKTINTNPIANVKSLDTNV